MTGKISGFIDTMSTYFTNTVDTHEKSIDCTAEFNRIAGIASKYWNIYGFEISLGVLMVDQGIRNAFLFEYIDHSLIPAFIDELNINSDKKYNFIIEKGYISKNKIDTNQSSGIILGYIQPEWWKDKTLNHKTFLCLVGVFDDDCIYVETSKNGTQCRLKMEEKCKYFNDSMKSISLDLCVTFEIQEFTNTECIHKELITLFENTSISDFEKMDYVKMSKFRIIDFLFTQDYFGENSHPAFPNKAEIEFENTFETRTISFWKKLIFKYKRLIYDE